MILSDDNSATIVYAVEQGRKLYDNLNKYIRFVLVMLVALIAAAEILGAAFVSGWDFLRRLLGTTQLTAQRWGLALLAALLVLWEVGKWIARRSAAAAPA
jgi:magnesium-transporting ATPase (P-type)